MGELRGSVDDPDGGDRHGRPERSGPQAPDTAVTRVGAELRSRTEYAADLEQRTVSGWEQRPFRPVMDGPAQASRTADAAGDPVARDKPLEALDRFEPRRAGLPDIAVSDAVTYLDSRQDTRPWLAGARDRPPEVQRVLAALDQGRGHAHIRHEGWVTEEMNERRVAFLEDPAQLDPAKRAARIDGLRQGEQLHGCRQAATRIVNPDAFASAFAKGIEHPKVRAALEAPYDPDDKPRPVQLPLGDLLGPDGHRYCTGWRLEPVDGSMAAARKFRQDWIGMPAEQRETTAQKPTARPVQTFEGGAVVFAFGHNGTADGYEVVTMYPQPRKHED